MFSWLLRVLLDTASQELTSVPCLPQWPHPHSQQVSLKGETTGPSYKSHDPKSTERVPRSSELEAKVMATPNSNKFGKGFSWEERQNTNSDKHIRMHREDFSYLNCVPTLAIV